MCEMKGSGIANTLFPSENERMLMVQMSECCPRFTKATSQKMAYFLDICQASLPDSGPLEEHILITLEEGK